MTVFRARRRRTAAWAASVAAACTFAAAGVTAARAAEPAPPATITAIDPAAFADPPIEYRPGVRWWWPGNGATEEDLLAQVEYLHDNGFGAVEIVAFSKGFLTGDGTTTGYLYDGADLGYDVDQILGYESPEYFEKLDAVIARANQLGITVDLNIGSGYLANDDSIDIADSQSNLALGRATVQVDATGALTLVRGDIDVPSGTGQVDVGIPDAEVSPMYASELFGFDFAEWSDEDVHLNAVILAPVTGDGALLENNNQALTRDFASVKTYTNQTLVDLADATVVHPDAGAGTFTVDTSALAEGAYEVIAVYSTPAGTYGLNSIIENTTTGERNYVVDHLNPSAITNLIDGWLGEAALNEIVASRDVRAAFNDSYEFYTDTHYNDLVQAAAQSEELLGYDITPFIPSLYAFFQESFLIDGAPTIKPEYSALGLEPLTLGRFGGGGVHLLAADLTEDEAARVEYDYGRLLDVAFRDGMAAFSDALGDYGIQYRQQAYNPPIDTLKSAEVVDIPETEGLDEYSLKRASSGAHLYGKNLVTSEVFTLGSTPFRITPDFMKQGYDLMATSGVNNFFYHGLSATYHGNTDPAFTSDDRLFPEEGWRAWPTIGVEIAGTAGIADYYASMNDYASRANYVMQAGTNSSDVAIYMPLFGSLASGGGFGGGAATPLAAITAAQTNGWAWDAINDDTIQTGLTWNGSELVANGGSAGFDALIVESDTVPVETMEALQRLQGEGAPIVLLGDAPVRQPGYAGGEYAAADARVAEIGAALGGAVDAAALVAQLGPVVDAPISYAANEDVRFARRALANGGELAYVRNTATDASTPVQLTVAEGLQRCFWLDQASGDIFPVGPVDGTVSATLDPAGAVILLCEPGAADLAAAAVVTGAPSSIDPTDRPVSHELTAPTLEVTADNIGSNRPGETRTVSYTGTVLGDWTSAEVAGGELRYVTDAGTYRTTVEIPDAGDLTAGGAVLSLGTVHDAATVRVNPGTPQELSVQLFSAPFEVDIAPALIDGTNVIEVEVQPVQSNRREGLKELYQSDPVANVQYQAYQSLHGGTGLMPAGLVGPITLQSAVESVAEPTTPTTPTTPPTEPPASGGPGGQGGGGGGGGDGSSTAGGRDGALADTGTDFPIGAVVAALALLVAGGLAVARSVLRRRARATRP